MALYRGSFFLDPPRGLGIHYENPEEDLHQKPPTSGYFLVTAGLGARDDRLS